MRKILGVLFSLSFILGMFSSAFATSYTGLITAGNGLFGTAGWDSTAAQLSWIVDDTTNSGFWTYHYTYTVPTKNISHTIIQVSDTFTASNIKQGTSPAPTIDSPNTWNGQGSSNPGIPEPLYGLKWVWTGLVADFILVTDRAPMWGDFYAQDGKDQTSSGKVDVYAYNTGFGFDTDAVIGDGNALDPSNELGRAWVLVPDTGAPVPEPATMFLLGSGLIGVGVFVRRKFKR